MQPDHFPRQAAKNEHRKGSFYAVAAYLMWGLFPLYWIPLQKIASFEILSHRIVWSFVFMTVLLLVEHKFSQFLAALHTFLASPKQFLLIVLASFLISINWFIYIWAVTHGHVVESSMGYYINPLVSILLAILFLKEKLTRWQILAVILAAAGVLVQTVGFGRFPIIALALAFSFGFYGLTKKLIPMDATLELTFETLCILPIALYYLIHLQISGTAAFASGSMAIDLLLIGTGIVTAVPLLFFAEAAQRISLTMIGFFQYITPTISLIIGITVYKEIFNWIQLISFSFIWLGLIVFSLSSALPIKRRVRFPHSV
ncbi:MAG: EamA family transporter RarD [Sporolactobacillus sp.]